MKLNTLLARILPLFVLAFGLATGALAQEGLPTPPPEPEDAPTEAAADARTEYAAAIEEAQAATAQGTAQGHIEAAEAYTRAAEIARDSADEELEANAEGALEAAVRSYVDAGGAYAAQQDYANAGAQFEQAAELAGQLEDVDLQARVTSNAGTAYIQAEDYESAVAAFERAAELLPDNLDYVYLRAEAIRRSGDTEAAETAFSELATRAEAAGDTQNLAKANEAAGRMHLMAARDAIQAENYGAAIAALNAAAEYLPEDDGNLNTFYANAYYRQGVNQVRAEQYGPARTSLQRAQEYARLAGRDQIVRGAQQQLDYIQQVQG